MKRYKIWYRGIFHDVFEMRVKSPKEGKKVLKCLVKYDNQSSRLLYGRPFHKRDAIYGIDYYNQDSDDWESLEKR